MKIKVTLVAAIAVAALPAAGSARESLGLFGTWGAFADAAGPRCYAIAMAEENPGKRDAPGYASIGTWPRRGVRGQVYFRSSQGIQKGTKVTLSVGKTRFELIGAGQSAWARDARGDAAIVAALRSARTMRLTARGATGRTFTDRYALEGVASALDAATVGCARKR